MLKFQALLSLKEEALTNLQEALGLYFEDEEAVE